MAFDEAEVAPSHRARPPRLAAGAARRRAAREDDEPARPAVEPVERSHSILLPVSFLKKKKTQMSTRFPIRNANIDEIWIQRAELNTTSNTGGVTLPSFSHSGVIATDQNGSSWAIQMITSVRPTIANAR